MNRIRKKRESKPEKQREGYAAKPKAAGGSVQADRRITMVFNTQHAQHHVHESGYVESPNRVELILSTLKQTGMFREIQARKYPGRHITAVHSPVFVNYLRKAVSIIPDSESIYPYVIPIRNRDRLPGDLTMRAGYFTIDTFTPLNKNAYQAARHAVNCALTAAESLLNGSRLAYALVRPPGHHAERAAFGGFCYFNSTAIAAHFLSRQGRTAILDLDYHHGNGQQNIFYHRNDVLTISIHGHPRFAYPFFCGFATESGEGEGLGFNVNYPLAECVTSQRYIETLKKAVRRIGRFEPEFLVVALGFDTARDDPTGTWMLDAEDFRAIGNLIGRFPCPTLFVQEGGYRLGTIGDNATAFFKGVHNGAFQ